MNTSERGCSHPHTARKGLGIGAVAMTAVLAPLLGIAASCDPAVAGQWSPTQAFTGYGEELLSSSSFGSV